MVKRSWSNECDSRLTEIRSTQRDHIRIVVIDTEVGVVEMPALVVGTTVEVVFETFFAILVVFLSQLLVFERLVSSIDLDKLLIGFRIVLKRRQKG